MRRSAGQAALACALTVAALPTAAGADAADASPLTGPASGIAAAATAGVAASAVGERTIRLRAAVRELTSGPETRAGYERDKFRDWYDATGTAGTPATRCLPRSPGCPSAVRVMSPPVAGTPTTTVAPGLSNYRLAGYLC
jgi:hypothetical protein